MLQQINAYLPLIDRVGFLVGAVASSYVLTLPWRNANAIEAVNERLDLQKTAIELHRQESSFERMKIEEHLRTQDDTIGKHLRTQDDKIGKLEEKVDAILMIVKGSKK
jgi:hypothetical protein